MLRFRKILQRDVLTVLLGVCFCAGALLFGVASIAEGTASEEFRKWLLVPIVAAFVVQIYMNRRLTMHHVRRTWMIWCSLLVLFMVGAVFLVPHLSPVPVKSSNILLSNQGTAIAKAKNLKAGLQSLTCLTSKGPDVVAQTCTDRSAAF